MKIEKWKRLILSSQTFTTLGFLEELSEAFAEKTKSFLTITWKTSRIYQSLTNLGSRFKTFRQRELSLWEVLDRRWGKLVEAGIILTIALAPVLNSWGTLLFLVLILKIIRFPERKLPDTGLFFFWLALVISSIMSSGLRGPGQLITVTVWILTAYLAGTVFSVNLSRKIIRLMLVTSLIWIIIGLRQQGAGVSTPSGWLEQGQNLLISVRSVSVFGNPNIYGLYLLSILIFALSEIAEQKLQHQFFSVVILILGAISLYYTYSRTAWILGLAGISIWFGKSFRSRKFLYILIVGLCLFCLPAFKTRLFSSGGFFEGTLWLRIRLWRNMLKILADFWLWGAGPGSFNEVYQSYSRANGLISHGHQLYLQLWLENGILSFLAFIRVLFKNLTGFISFQSTVRAVALTIFSFLLFGFLETWWAHQFCGGYFWLLVGLLQSLRTGRIES
jgi:O-antigen ligase